MRKKEIIPKTKKELIGKLRNEMETHRFIILACAIVDEEFFEELQEKDEEICELVKLFWRLPNLGTHHIFTS